MHTTSIYIYSKTTRISRLNFLYFNDYLLLLLNHKVSPFISKSSIHKPEILSFTITISKYPVVFNWVHISIKTEKLKNFTQLTKFFCDAAISRD